MNIWQKSNIPTDLKAQSDRWPKGIKSGGKVMERLRISLVLASDGKFGA